MQIDLSALEIYLLAPRHAIDYKNKEKNSLKILVTIGYNF